MMTVGRYLIVAIVVFLIGLTALHAGVNRPPFRQAPQQEHTGKQHGAAPVEKTPATGTTCPESILQPGKK